MSSARRGWIKAGGGAAVVLLIAGVTLAVLTLLDVTFQGEGEAQTGLGSQRTGTTLLTANRDRLAVCIDTVEVEPGPQVTAKNAIQAALSEAEKDPSWEKAGLAEQAPLVALGCPAPPAVLLPNAHLASTGKFGLIVDGAPEVKEASYYRLFIFVMPPAKLTEVFGKEYPIATQEWLRESVDQITPVTHGFYVTPEQIADPEQLSQWFLFIVGGVRSAPEATSGVP